MYAEEVEWGWARLVLDIVWVSGINYFVIGYRHWVSGHPADWGGMNCIGS